MNDKKCKNPNCNNFLVGHQKVYCSRHCQSKNINIGRKFSKEILDKKKEQYKSGMLKVWNKGLTKETDERVRKYVESNKKPWSEERKLEWKNSPNLGKSMLGKHHSDETKKKMSESWTEERKLHHNCIGRIATVEEIEKRRNSFKTSIKAQEYYKRLRNYETDKERRQKIRIATLKRIMKDNQFLSIGKNETRLLDEQELKDNCKILRQWNTGIGYIVDGYCPETNTVYEVYELAHYHDFNKIQKDIDRQNLIINHLNCNYEIICDYRNNIDSYIRKFVKETKNWFNNKSEELEQIRKVNLKI